MLVLFLISLLKLFIFLALGPGVYSASNRNEYQKHEKKKMFLRSEAAAGG
jgi:hypothetical protein